MIIEMHPCSGCFEAGDYDAFAHLYAWSEEHRCRIGAGCSECEDTGLVELRIPSDDEIAEMMAAMDDIDPAPPPGA